MFAILPVRLMVRVSSNAMKHNNKKKHATVLNSKMSLNRDDERVYCNSHSENIIGVDEAGRGPLAGPVVAAACFVPQHVKFDGIIDSKATKEEDREVTYEQLTTTDGVLWGVSIVSHTDIDELNILQASLKAMSTAVKDLISKSKAAFDISNCHILVDGNKVPSDLPDDALSKVAVVKGDSRIYSIAAASIIAKVTRDRLMVEMDKQFPIYGFAQHKGYPTAAHRSILLEHGPCPTHRLSYGPVLAAAKRHGMLLPAPAAAT
eukprot:gene9446-12763_t